MALWHIISMLMIYFSLLSTNLGALMTDLACVVVLVIMIFVLLTHLVTLQPTIHLINTLNGGVLPLLLNYYKLLICKMEIKMSFTLYVFCL